MDPAGTERPAAHGIVQRPPRALLSRVARAAIVAGVVAVVAYGLALALTWLLVPGAGSSVVYTTEQRIDWFTIGANTTVVAGLIAAVAAVTALVLAAFVVVRRIGGRRRAS
ncbi:hypothetical protein ASF89_06580 [Frigoribacterium sp. Leaf172]|nr:hypothetical protein ASF89_06580 [Frigoribacterium sp. Leaf172]